MKEKEYQLAIVGFGARGLHALELFYSTLSRKQTSKFPQTVIFESHKSLGTGLAWDPEQSAANCSNISDRALDTLFGREEFRINNITIPAFPSYLQWLDEVMDVQLNDQKDSFSLRKVTGAYLVHRAQSIMEPLQSLGLVDILQQRIVAIQDANNQFTLTSKDQQKYTSGNVILALGHLPTDRSVFTKQCVEHGEQEGVRYSHHPYTAIASTIYKDARVVLVKGLGLAMIDVVRMIVHHHDGFYVQNENSIFLEYKGKKDVKIVPYSLDGLAMVPKPVGKVIDDHFDPTRVGKTQMLQQLKADIAANKIKTVDDILRPIARLVAKIYKGFEHAYSTQHIDEEDCINLIVEWFKNPSTKSDHIIDIDMCIVDYMRLTCKMSHGKHPFSLDYTAGQVWRELQIDMYYIFSYDLLPHKLVAGFIAINEKAKRYSFGPPVDSILELIALQESGILNLEFHKDPSISFHEKGYELSHLTNSIICDSMVDSVLAKPNLAIINDVLMSSILEKPLAVQFEDNLGIQVSDTANHLVNGSNIDGLHSLGRNAKGSIYGVDAILECFNTDKMQPVINTITNRIDILH